LWWLVAPSPLLPGILPDLPSRGEESAGRASEGVGRRRPEGAGAKRSAGNARAGPRPEADRAGYPFALRQIRVVAPSTAGAFKISARLRGLAEGASRHGHVRITHRAEAWHALEHLAQSDAGDARHGVVAEAVLLAVTEDGHDVGMVQSRGRTGLGLEPPQIGISAAPAPPGRASSSTSKGSVRPLSRRSSRRATTRRKRSRYGASIAAHAVWSQLAARLIRASSSRRSISCVPVVAIRS
jgi:hypothetical protein